MGQKWLNEELDRLDVGAFKKATKIPVTVMLDNIRSMQNTGSLFRTSDAFRVEHILLCGITATPPNKEIHKTALGATESVEWSYHEDSLEVLQNYRSNGYIICSVEQVDGSVELQEFQFDSNRKYLVVFGHEVKGVGQEVVDHSDHCIEIPQFGTKHSLNISVSAGMVIWEAFKQLRRCL